MWQNYFSQVLHQSFEQGKQADRKFSLRAFARQLDVSAGVLSELLRAQRSLSKARALEIAKRAKLEAPVLSRLQEMMAEHTQAESGELSQKALELILDPLYYRILCALEILPTPASLESLSSFLSVPEEKLKDRLVSLMGLEVLTFSAEGILWSGRYPSTTEDVPNQKIREFHRQTLADAAQDLELPVESREFTTITFAACEDELPEAKNEIRKFRDSLSKRMRSSKPDKIFQLSIQLRPVSQSLKGPEDVS